MTCLDNNIDKEIMKSVFKSLIKARVSVSQELNPIMIVWLQTQLFFKGLPKRLLNFEFT